MVPHMKIKRRAETSYMCSEAFIQEITAHRSRNGSNDILSASKMKISVASFLSNKLVLLDV